MANLAEIFGRIIGDEHIGIRVADYLAENPHATASDLAKFDKVGVSTATTLLMVMENSAEYLAGTKQIKVSEPETIASRLSWMKWEQQENLVVMTLDSVNHIINTHIVTKGLINQTPFHPRELLRPAILDNAASIIMVHNHPSGSSEPSPEDIAITRCMAAACRILRIPILDHVIITRSGFTSICRRYPEIFEETFKNLDK